MGHEKNLQNKIPVKLKKLKTKPKKYTRAYVLMNEKKEILVRTRSSKGMLASMLEVPNDDWVDKKNMLQKNESIEKINKPFLKKGSLSYSFSHFDLDAEIFFTSVNKNKISKGKWLKASSYFNSQLPTVMKKIVKVALLNQE